MGVGSSSQYRHEGREEQAMPAGAPLDARAEDGRRQQFLDLLMPFYPQALAYAQSITGSLMDGEDLVSDAVLRAYEGLDTLKDRGKFKEWFFSILLNRFRNLRSRSLLRPLTLVADFAGPSVLREATTRVSGDPAELGYQLTLVKELLARLQPRERDILLLLGPAGFSVDEVASIQRVSKRAVIQCAYRARRKLARALPADALPFAFGAEAAEIEGGQQ
ncbi:RNA polymerase sigma factor [bacterium]|nr:RNA polymerase sigma factor [bacterium]